MYKVWKPTNQILLACALSLAALFAIPLPSSAPHPAARIDAKR